MVFAIVILTVVVFILVDLALRFLIKKYQEAKTKSERKKALHIGLKLNFVDEAKTLKRVEVAHPKAKILAVDDEKIVLDAFRKILVLEGYCVDTVETGKEAITLARDHNYDFVFTDLKMPEMNGIDVTKAVKHLRPDIDVIVITGYATIESAIETMKYGAMDYIQKPFTEEELNNYVNQFLIRRQDRLEKRIIPKVRLLTSTVQAASSKHEFNVPAGIFISPSHIWAHLESNGSFRVGLDDFIQKIIGKIDEIYLPKKGKMITTGGPLFSFRRGSFIQGVSSPVNGKVTTINENLLKTPELVNSNPYELGWICCIDASNLSKDLENLKIGADAISWYADEINKFAHFLREQPKPKTQDSNADLEGKGTGDINEEFLTSFCQKFLHT